MSYIAFRSPVGFHLYDREINQILTLQDNEYEALISLNAIVRVNEYHHSIINKLQGHGFCSDTTLKEIKHPHIDSLDSFLSQRVKSVVLQVTQGCNLRCSYCVYSGNYYNRTHNNQIRMSKDIAFKAVDFLMNYSTAVDMVNIGFYGGEPLLEIELIREVIAYVKKEYPERVVEYSMTSNLTLLTDDIIDFLIENQILLTISIDGPESIQDKYRLFPDGKGSYAIVRNNMKRMVEKCKPYLNYCSTNTVISPGTNYEEVLDFLDYDDLFGQITSRFTLVSSTCLRNPVHYDDEYYIAVNRKKYIAMLAMLGEIDREKFPSTTQQMESSIISLYNKLKLGGLKGVEKAHPSGPCIPGEKKLFVDWKGDIFPCEKVPESNNFLIGNIQKGLDMHKIKELISIGKLTEHECINCWAFMYCTTCISMMIDKDSISQEVRLSRCSEVKSIALDNFKDLVTLQHYGYAFDYSSGSNN